MKNIWKEVIFGILIGLITFILKMIVNSKNKSTGQPSEDEFSKLAKVYAGNQAFQYSMYLWLIIFIYNDSFSKDETMLGIGILGSALLYGLTLWYKKSTGQLHA